MGVKCTSKNLRKFVQINPYILLEVLLQAEMLELKLILINMQLSNHYRYQFG